MSYKIAIFCQLILASNFALAGTFKKVVDCSGIASIQGILFHRQDNLKLSLNAYRTGGLSGHIAQIDEKSYYHGGDLASCVTNNLFINCIGSGVGNGPELIVKIDKRTMEASGSYFNPWARKGMKVPNEYNTYVFERLICKIH
jgi:hypothetical protein